MKQQIICRGCAVTTIERWSIEPDGGKANPYPGETVGVEHGHAKQDFVCDLCNVSIEPGDQCAAYGIASDRAPWIEGWEAIYIDAL